MRGEGHILVYCPIDTFQWGSTHSAMCSTISWLSLNWEVIRGLIDQSLMDFWPLAGRLTFTS